MLWPDTCRTRIAPWTPCTFLRQRFRTPTGFQISRYEDGRVTISGLAADTSLLQGLLEADPLFQEVQFAGAVTPDPSGSSRFTLEMTLEAAP